MLVAEVVETYLREETGRLAQSTRRSEAISGAHITRLIGQVPIADLTPRMVRDFHRALAKTPRTANLALGFLSKVCDLAEILDERPSHSNPCGPVRGFPERPRQRFFTVAEIRELLLAADWLEASFNLPGSGGLSAASADLFRLLIFTGCRVGEAKSLQRHEVDLDRRLLVLDSTKTTQHLTQIRPISEAAVGVARRRFNTTTGPWLFPGRRPGRHLVEHQRAWVKLVEAAEVKYASVHTLRHSFASTAAVQGLPLAVIGACLGHKDPRSTGRYAHLAPQESHHVADHVADIYLARRSA